MSSPPILAPRSGCECTGHGYAVFSCDGEGHSSLELQRIDSCLCLGLRFGMPDEVADKASDSDAAIAFVYDLERADAFAQRCAFSLLSGGGAS